MPEIPGASVLAMMKKLLLPRPSNPAFIRPIISWAGIICLPTKAAHLFGFGWSSICNRATTVFSNSFALRASSKFDRDIVSASAITEISTDSGK
jgi:hypothetical protein